METGTSLQISVHIHTIGSGPSLYIEVFHSIKTDSVKRLRKTLIRQRGGKTDSKGPEKTMSIFRPHMLYSCSSRPFMTFTVRYIMCTCIIACWVIGFGLRLESETFKAFQKLFLGNKFTLRFWLFQPYITTFGYVRPANTKISMHNLHFRTLEYLFIYLFVYFLFIYLFIYLFTMYLFMRLFI